MSIKISKISYFSFSFQLNEKKKPLKKYDLQRGRGRAGGYKKVFAGGRFGI